MSPHAGEGNKPYGLGTDLSILVVATAMVILLGVRLYPHVVT